MPTLTDAIAASASALAAERTRIEAAISNLANAESTRGPNGPYRRREVVLAPTRRTNSMRLLAGQAPLACGLSESSKMIAPSSSAINHPTRTPTKPGLWPYQTSILRRR